jgi:hypothetical protein
LAAVKKLSCVFPALATGRWSNGEPQAEARTAALKIAFDAIDTDDGTGRSLGTYGPQEIIVRFSGGTLHLIQSLRDGPLYITSVFSKETRGGKLQAVHTRHEYADVVLPGYTSSPEQYYGECELG